MQFNRLKRREFITLLGGAAAWPLAARAQQRDPPARVGILTLGGAPGNPLFAAFRQAMRGFGYVEGRNLVLEFRSAADDPKRLPELAAELVRLSVKVMLVEGTAAARAAKEATSSINCDGRGRRAHGSWSREPSGTSRWQHYRVHIADAGTALSALAY
jgi:putative tryptophan/tyrosine transport system substrate-binding protein